jgi:YggT family protein
MTEAFIFLIKTVFNLFLMVVLLRLWLQSVRADFYNPLSQFVVKATNPLLIPLRRLIPSIGALDTASLVLAMLVATAQVLTFQLLGGHISAHLTLVGALALLITEAFNLVFWVVIIRAIMSWFSQGRNPMEHLLSQLTEPLLSPIRRVIPSVGGLDLSVLVLLVGMQFLQILLKGLLNGLL